MGLNERNQNIHTIDQTRKDQIMKTITSFTILLIAMFTFSLVSCEKAEQEKTVSQKEVPQAVLKAFNDSYPGATIMEYSEETEDGEKYFEISCEFAGRKIDAVYHPDGSVSAIEEVIPIEALPQAVQQAIAREVPQFSIKLAEKIDKAGETLYEVKILNTQDQKTYELQFSDMGKLLEKEVKKSKEQISEEEEMEESGEEHEMISVPDEVTAAFNAKFSGATDINWGKESAAEYEAEFNLNGKTMSANFDAAGKWIETESKLSKNELPSAVLSILKSEYGNYQVLKAERLEKPGKPATFEVKLSKDETVVEVVVDESGKLLKKEINEKGEEAEQEEENK
jgi:hypothetical protein